MVAFYFILSKKLVSMSYLMRSPLLEEVKAKRDHRALFNFLKTISSKPDESNARENDNKITLCSQEFSEE